MTEVKFNDLIKGNDGKGKEGHGGGIRDMEGCIHKIAPENLFPP